MLRTWTLLPRLDLRAGHAALGPFRYIGSAQAKEESVPTINCFWQPINDKYVIGFFDRLHGLRKKYLRRVSLLRDEVYWMKQQRTIDPARVPGWPRPQS